MELCFWCLAHRIPHQMVEALMVGREETIRILPWRRLITMW